MLKHTEVHSWFGSRKIEGASNVLLHPIYQTSFWLEMKHIKHMKKNAHQTKIGVNSTVLRIALFKPSSTQIAAGDCKEK